MQKLRNPLFPKRIIIALAMLLSAILLSLLSRFLRPDVPSNPPVQSEINQGQVKRVIDGDTLDVVVMNSTLRVRLRGIDAPEKDQPWGDQSVQMLKSYLPENLTVCLRLYGQDRYGRELAELLVDRPIPASVSMMPCSASVNRLMVLNGGAWVYRYKGKAVDSDLLSLEDNARSHKRGLWTESEPVPPWQWRVQHQIVDPKILK
ncbi:MULTISPECIES: thermonuclease family protein [Serratia]|uniref:thermonuclease family protein n=1 Tax=Serratia TaxID=613 RepID=UPI0009E1BCF9|nr:thermonuclease family protein [Serratia sp. 506_PEND]